MSTWRSCRRPYRPETSAEAVVPTGKSVATAAGVAAVVTPQDGWRLEGIQTVRTRYSDHRFPMLGSYPGATTVAQVDLPIPTYRGKDGQPPIQFDYLMATKPLADRCGRISLLNEETKELSDHVPIIAEFEILTLERSWSGDGFLVEVEMRTNAMGRRVVEEMIAWAERKQGHLERGPVRRIDLLRLPISAGPDLEMAFQLESGDAIANTYSRYGRIGTHG